MKIYIVRNIEERITTSRGDSTFEELLDLEDLNVKVCRTFTDQNEAYKVLRQQKNHVHRGYSFHNFDEWNVWFLEIAEYEDSTNESLLNKTLSDQEQKALEEYFIEGSDYDFEEIEGNE